MVVELNPTLNLSSPLVLNPNDNPAVAIVLDPFTGSNFLSWSNAVKRALSVKNKLALLDGSLSNPFVSEDEVVLAAWKRANGLVLMWILNSIHIEVKRSLKFFTVAKDLWDELHLRYTRSDGTRIYHLDKSLSSIAKGSQSLVAYYNSFKSLWDEFVSYRPVLHCNCGNCTCDLSKIASQLQEKDCVMKFLTGLDDSYSSIRSQLLMQDPLPSLTKIYSILLQEESQRELSHPLPSIGSDSIALLAKNAKFFREKKKPMICSNCEQPGHTIDRCFQLIGYPPGWRGPKGKKGKNENYNSANCLSTNPSNNVASENFTNDIPVSANPLFSQELFDQFLAFAKNQKSGDKSHLAAGAIAQTQNNSVSDVGPSSGQCNTEDDWFC